MKKKFIIVIILAVILIVFFLIIKSNEQPVEIIPRHSKIPEDAVKITPQSDYYPPIRYTNEYTDPVPVKGDVNTAGAEDSAFILPNGNELYVWFTPDPLVPVIEQLVDKVTGIYYYTKSGDEWIGGDKVVLNKKNEDTLDGCLFVGNGQAWFCSARKGNLPPEGLNFWTADISGNKVSHIKNAGKKLNVDYKIGELHITSDDKEMYYHKADGDIYMLENINGEWQNERKVENINSDDFEGYPFVNEDIDEMWITRTYLGTPALLRSKRIDGQWQKPELMFSQFAGEATLDDQGNVYFTHHFFEYGEMIEADIYVAYKK